jgi:hypothetical protein
MLALIGWRPDKSNRLRAANGAPVVTAVVVNGSN